MVTPEEAKRKAARAALDELPADSARAAHAPLVVGLGTGSTAKLFVEELAARVNAGLKLVGVPTSEATRAQASSLGIPLLDNDGPWDIDVTIDGADEVSAALDLIKGGGGAHTREKIVNFASRRNVIIVDGSKMSRLLGERWSVPVEVLPFAHGTTCAALARHGNPVLRRRVGGDGAVVRTDAGNLIYDLGAGTIADPGKLDRALRAIPGVVETGLFVGRADVVLVADEGGVRRLARA